MTGLGVRAAGALLCVFVLGVVTGLAIERHLVARPTVTLIAGAGEHDRRMGELRDALDLDEAQVDEINALVATHQTAVQVLWEQLRPEVQAAMQDVHLEISELLRPEQRERFHDWLMSHQEAAAEGHH
ncbi:MAG: hypothetical protein GKS06_03460 [Acidobacteria bacterium]|nr:hypothetical protein [Acidobacteriota bacterium]